METQLNECIAVLLTSFALGLRHDLDADHLATLNGLARFNSADRPSLARGSGFLFSLGHGLVATLIAAAAGIAAERLNVPAWMESLGA